MIVIYRVLLVGVFSGVVYFAFPLFMANVVAATAQYAVDKKSVYQKVLTWQSDHKEALAQLAVISLQEQRYDEAVDFSRQALGVDPTNGRAMSVLITAYDALGKPQKAEKALELATKLWPSHAYVRGQSADFWAKRGEIEKTLVEWNVLLTRHSSFYKDIFPVLKVFVETGAYQHLLQPYYQEPALWWKDFFIYLVRQDIKTEVIYDLYQKRLSIEVPVTLRERSVYVSRLIKEKHWVYAYSAWLGGLEKQEREWVSLVNNGSFEVFTEPSAFGWVFRNRPHVKASFVQSRGGDGKQAFKVAFNKRKPVVNSIIYQRLLLEPGRAYQVTFRSKLEGLKNDVGLKWRVKCADSSWAMLASSESLKGREKWSDSSFDVVIPEQDCKSQILELTTGSRFHHERFFQGSALFDDIKIMPIAVDTDKDSSDENS